MAVLRIGCGHLLGVESPAVFPQLLCLLPLLPSQGSSSTITLVMLSLRH